MISISKVTGNVGVSSMQCINPVKDRWAVRWGNKPNEEGKSATYMEAIFNHKPTIDEVKSLVIGWYNEQINQHILSGFAWRGTPVWLSSENQFNYKAAHDLAVQTNGGNLPVIFKLGTDEEPVYHTFETVAELSDFFLSAMKFVNETIEKGWKEKDQIDWKMYE